MSELQSRLAFRPINDTDLSLLRDIYASSRENEMALVVQWTEEDKTAFLDQQFQAQHSYYQHQYRNAEFLIMLLDGVPAGRLYVDDRATDIRIVDITILPGFRNQGLGHFILTNLQQKARNAGKSVSIHVERDNRARHLYERLDFQITNDSHPIYLLLTWQDNL